LYSIVLVLILSLFYRITVIGWSALSCCKPLLSDIIIIIIIAGRRENRLCQHRHQPIED